MVSNITTTEQLMNHINNRIKTVTKVIEEIESEGWMDGEKYSDETEYQKDLSYYEGKLDELVSLNTITKTSQTKEPKLKLDFDLEGCGEVSYVFQFKLEEETRSDVTYTYQIWDSYCNEDSITFTKKEIKEELESEFKNDPSKLRNVIGNLISNSIN
jgi:hypothetical protein